jgi:serine/threonine-protein kinase
MDTTTLLGQLRAIGLWPEDPALGRCIEELSRQTTDAKLLARELLQRNLLTAYQANQILAGKGRSLVVGPYRLLERLGEGATGQVFKARHDRLRRLAALKLIRPDCLTNPAAVSRFHREVQAAATLAHPNVVRAYDADQVGGIFYFAMEYVPGTNLTCRVRQAGPLLLGEACEIMRQAALGLAHIHEHGMVHRDIKPSNLAITEAAAKGATKCDPSSTTLLPGQVKILDLGLARLSERLVEEQVELSTLTQVGTVMGTTDFMAPEQGRDSHTADARSDLYSLGCTLYFSLTGKPPFPGGTALEKMMHHQLDEPEPVEKLRPDVPPGLAAVMRRLMAKEPAARYQKAAEVAEALATACTAAPSPVRPAMLGATPEFTLGEPGLGPLVVLTPQATSPHSRRLLGEWAWVGIATAAAAGVLGALALVRLLLR